MSVRPRKVTDRRIILHVDMDQFFAAVEEREHPEFKGRPVIVGADPKGGEGRGVVSTCNYEARKFGVHSGMPISRAWKRCPDAIYVRPNFKLYIETSTRIMKLLRRHADEFERWGLDEAFLDITSKVRNLKKARRLAEELKLKIYRSEKITCSIGIGPNKLVAKIASDYKKPDGLTVVGESSVKRFLAPLPVRRLLWVGKKTERRLNEMGIKTIGDLAAFDVSALVERFGAMGTQYHLFAQGIDESEVAERGEAKSVSRETTFEKDTNDYDLVLATINELSQEIHKEIVEDRKVFRTVTVKIRYENFETHTHGKTLPSFTNRLQDIQKTARELAQNYLRGDRMIRLVGVRLSTLASSKEQRTLA
ncbi:MAG: DNA polymerase IV [Candidatus Bathyarchaeota archaeon]|nr:MAG: DNA polymerase IV [Candidatus Bathyarchaeota archaeon]